jgi:MraZ protein
LALFTGVVVNKVDRKGRVSVPAPYRNALVGQSFHGVAVYPTADGSPALEGSGVDLLEELSARFRDANPFAPAFANARMAIFSNVELLGFDGDGRVLLSQQLIGHTGIETHAAFVGLGDRFQIWQPDALEKARREAMARAVDELANLDLPPPARGGGG